MESIAWEGKIVSVKRGTVFVNAGGNSNVRVGDEFTIYQKGDDLIDPDRLLVRAVPNSIARSFICPRYSQSHAWSLKNWLTNSIPSTPYFSRAVEIQSRLVIAPPCRARWFDHWAREIRKSGSFSPGSSCGRLPSGVAAPAGEIRYRVVAVK